MRFNEAGDRLLAIGEFDMSEEDYLFMKQFAADAVYDDYDRLVQLCDSLAMPGGFCFLENKSSFEKEMGCSVYTLLPRPQACPMEVIGSLLCAGIRQAAWRRKVFI